MKKEHFMIRVEKNKDRCFLFGILATVNWRDFWAVYGSRRNHPLPIQQSDSSKTLWLSVFCVCVGEFTRTRRYPRRNWKPGEHPMRKELIPRDILVSHYIGSHYLKKLEELGSAILVPFVLC